MYVFSTHLFVPSTNTASLQCLLYRKLREAQQRQRLASEMLSDAANQQVRVLSWRLDYCLLLKQIADEEVLKLTMVDAEWSPLSKFTDFATIQFTPRIVYNVDQQLLSVIFMFQVRTYLESEHIDMLRVSYRIWASPIDTAYRARRLYVFYCQCKRAIEMCPTTIGSMHLALRISHTICCVLNRYDGISRECNKQFKGFLI